MDVNDVAESDIIEIPEMAKQIFPTHDLVGIAHEVFEKAKFLQGKRNVTPTLRRSPRHRIELDILAPQYFRDGLARATRERPETRGELREGKRLHEIIVGTRK